MVTAMSHNPTLTMLRLLCVLALLLALPVEGGVYKCAAANGAVIYQDTACAEGKELRNLEADPATLSVVPGTPVPRFTAKPAAQPKPAKVRAAAVKSRGGDPSERKFLRTGMSEAEVLHRIGRPDTQLNSRRKEGRQWSYLPTAGDADTLTTVTFNGGAVIRVERKVVR
jgi:uncharacterized protein DUF4124